ncbi:MAG: hypothetical protein WC764_01290 [Candidatus Paceibacterota bacterium]|jgi:cell division septal protein FtsQ
MVVIRGRAITAIKKEQRQKKLKRSGITAGLVLLNIIIYLLALALAFRLPVLRIETVAVQGVVGSRETEVSSTVTGLLKQNTFLIFPRYTMISSPGSMTADLMKAVPWVEKATIALESPHGVRISVTERTPVYIVCGPDGICYYADRNTLVFAPAPALSAPVYPELRSPRLASSTLMMTNVFNDDVPEKLRKLIELFSAQNLSISSFEETDEGSFRVFIKNGWYVLFTKDQSAQDVADSLRATIASARFAGEYVGHPHSLEYIDVRLGDKVFYKFKGTGSNATTTSAHN